MTTEKQLLKALYAVVELPDGQTVSTRLGDLNAFFSLRLGDYAAQSARISLACLMMLLLCLTSRTYKSVLFVLYQSNLFLSFLCAIFAVCNLKADVNGLLFVLTHDANLMTQNTLNVLAAGEVFTILLIISIECTLIFQIWVAFGDVTRKYRIATTIASAVACLPCLILWAWCAIQAVIYAYDPMYQTSLPVSKSMWPVFAVTTSVCSVVLSAKLLYSTRRRARLGIEAFDPLRAIFLTATQNGVIPAIIAIVVAASDQHVSWSLAGCTTIITAVLLPLGYIWAQFRILKHDVGVAKGPERFDTGTTDVDSNSRYNWPAAPNSAYSDYDSSAKAEFPSHSA